MAKECWSRMNKVINPDGYSSFADWIHDNIKALHKDDLSLLILLCWNIWQRRNDKVWRRVSTSTLQIIERTFAYLDEWRKITGNDCIVASANGGFTVKWFKPHPGWTKLNVDVALVVTGGKMGFGWILRDDQGLFRGAKCTPWRGAF
ncbi:PREDICTED: uncharacterized protein LOC109174472 [Ipomoea nil]|uniref:uncharacterized protein LOC109174472 n=1 Tax=Ipomoea nil TaxID=35883 RepID=UPI000901C618|nr:PREDICTED: uncharacterized protein LOC109174472 [Ipomoea nil]